ncbi:Protein PHOSPHATE STARVATION RESPONSE 1 [Linum perenne]
MVRWTVILHECFTFVVNQLGGIERASPEDVFRLMKNQGLTISDIELYLQASLYTIWHAEETLRTFRMNMDISREKMRRYLNRKKLSEERRASTDHATGSDATTTDVLIEHFNDWVLIEPATSSTKM